METKTKTQVTDLERIASIFKLKADDEFLVLKIRDIVQAKHKEIKKKDFCNTLLKEQVKKYEKQIHNIRNEYAESIGITEHMMVKQSRDVLKKNYQKVLEENYKLNGIIRNYREDEFKDRLKKIVR